MSRRCGVEAVIDRDLAMGAIHFLEGGKRAIITSLDTAVPALRGETGTHIVPDADLDTADPA
jgi:carbamate kinase